MRALLVCPGRGSYQKAHLGMLQEPHPVIEALDSFRSEMGRPTLTELDAAERFSASRHVAGENASLLTFGASARDIALIDPEKVDVVAVAGNSMGFYTALHASGCLSLLEAAHLVETMGAFQKGNVIGGQLLYPTVDEDWLPHQESLKAVEAVCSQEDIHLSIRLGGTAVIGASREGLRRCMEDLPKRKQGAREFPLQLPLHSAFHTPLLQETATLAQQVLKDLPLRSPHTPLVAGDGRVFGRWSDPQAVLSYTLGAQVTDTYDFSLCIRAALGDFAPEAIVLPGPGDTLGGPIAQTMIELGWRGLRDKQDFLEAQSSDTPVLFSMAWPKQRKQVTA